MCGAAFSDDLKMLSITCCSRLFPLIDSNSLGNPILRDLPAARIIADIIKIPNQIHSIGHPGTSELLKLEFAG